jgi:hypothetical protein
MKKMEKMESKKREWRWKMILKEIMRKMKMKKRKKIKMKCKMNLMMFKRKIWILNYMRNQIQKMKKRKRNKINLKVIHN